jgi:hypothetical protein
MFTEVPLSALNGVGVVGIVCFVGWMFWRAITVVPKGRRLPRLVLGREAETYLELTEKADANLATLLESNANLTAVGRLARAIGEAAMTTKAQEEAAADRPGDQP